MKLKVFEWILANSIYDLENLVFIDLSIINCKKHKMFKDLSHDSLSNNEKDIFKIIGSLLEIKS